MKSEVDRSKDPPRLRLLDRVLAHIGTGIPNYEIILKKAFVAPHISENHAVK